MTEMEPREAEIDRLLQRSLAAPIPSLPSDFDRRLMRKVRRSSEVLSRYRWILVTGYGLLSAVASGIVMRGQGLTWEAIALLLFTPLALVATVLSAWRALRSRFGESRA